MLKLNFKFLNLFNYLDQCICVPPQYIHIYEHIDKLVKSESVLTTKNIFQHMNTVWKSEVLLKKLHLSFNTLLSFLYTQFIHSIKTFTLHIVVAWSLLKNAS